MSKIWTCKGLLLGASALLSGISGPGCGDSTGPGLGAVRVALATTGADLDPDGYALSVDGGPAQAVDVNGAVTLTGLGTGRHWLALRGVASNCAAIGENPRAVTITAGHTAEVVFAVACVNAGGLRVRTSTTGTDLPGGYVVSVDDGGGAWGVAANGEVTIPVIAGSHTVALTNVADNCTVADWSPRVVSVSAGDTAAVAFEVNCVGRAATVTMIPAADTIGVGATAQFIATPRDSIGNPLIGREVFWYIEENPTVATVSPSGVAVGLAPGITTVGARVDYVTGTAQLVVTGTPVNVAGEWRIAEQFTLWTYSSNDFVCTDSGSLTMLQNGFSVTGTLQVVGTCPNRTGGQLDSGTVSGRVVRFVAAGCHYALEVLGDSPSQLNGSCLLDNGYFNADGAEVHGSRVGTATSGVIPQARPLAVAESGRSRSIPRPRRRS